MQRTETYQDVFLNQARRERTPLTVFLVNGFQMRGVITGFDPFVILLPAFRRQAADDLQTRGLDHHAVGAAAPEPGGVAIATAQP